MRSAPGPVVRAAAEWSNRRARAAEPDAARRDLVPGVGTLVAAREIGSPITRRPSTGRRRTRGSRRRAGRAAGAKSRRPDPIERAFLLQGVCPAAPGSSMRFMPRGHHGLCVVAPARRAPGHSRDNADMLAAELPALIERIDAAASAMHDANRRSLGCLARERKGRKNPNRFRLLDHLRGILAPRLKVVARMSESTDKRGRRATRVSVRSSVLRVVGR